MNVSHEISNFQNLLSRLSFLKRGESDFEHFWSTNELKVRASVRNQMFIHGLGTKDGWWTEDDIVNDVASDAYDLFLKKEVRDLCPYTRAMSKYILYEYLTPSVRTRRNRSVNPDISFQDPIGNSDRTYGDVIAAQENTCQSDMSDDLDNLVWAVREKIFKVLTDKEKSIYDFYFRNIGTANEAARDLGLSVFAVYSSGRRISRKIARLFNLNPDTVFACAIRNPRRGGQYATGTVQKTC